MTSSREILQALEESRLGGTFRSFKFSDMELQNGGYIMSKPVEPGPMGRFSSSCDDEPITVKVWSEVTNGIAHQLF